MRLIEFKSDPHFFFLERDGLKPNTVRKDDPDDERFVSLDRGEPKKIRIRNSGNPSWVFTREITDVSYWNGFWIISWKHKEALK